MVSMGTDSSRRSPRKLTKISRAQKGTEGPYKNSKPAGDRETDHWSPAAWSHGETTTMPRVRSSSAGSIHCSSVLHQIAIQTICRRVRTRCKCRRSSSRVLTSEASMWIRIQKVHQKFNSKTSVASDTRLPKSSKTSSNCL